MVTDTTKILQAIEKLSKDVSGLKTEVFSLKKGQVTMQSDISSLKKGQKIIGDNVLVLNADVKEIKNDLFETKKVLTDRMDIIGLQVANLEDDSPTIEEFDKLKSEVFKIKSKLAVV